MSVGRTARATRSGSDDLETFTALYDRYAPRIHAFAFCMMGDADEATALTRGVFLQAYRALGRSALGCDAGGDLNVWLHRIAADACLIALRRRRWRPWGIGRYRRPVISGSADRQGGLTASTTARLVWDSLRGVSPRNRVALVLRDHTGLSCAEIGAVLGLSREATKAILFRAREEYRVLHAWLAEGP